MTTGDELVSDNESARSRHIAQQACELIANAAGGDFPLSDGAVSLRLEIDIKGGQGTLRAIGIDSPMHDWDRPGGDRWGVDSDPFDFKPTPDLPPMRWPRHPRDSIVQRMRAAVVDWRMRHGSAR